MHDIDVLHYLTGSRIVRIWATATPSRREHAVRIEKEDQVEEGAAIMLGLNGCLGRRDPWIESSVVTNDKCAILLARELDQL